MAERDEARTLVSYSDAYWQRQGNKISPLVDKGMFKHPIPESPEEVERAKNLHALFMAALQHPSTEGIRDDFVEVARRAMHRGLITEGHFLLLDDLCDILSGRLRVEPGMADADSRASEA